MIEVNPWLFIVLIFSSMAAYVFGFLYVAHWWLHKRPLIKRALKPKSPLILPNDKEFKP